MPAAPDVETVASRAYAKVTWRILPVLLAAYALGVIDRGNVSYGQLAMQDELGFTDAIYGLGAGIFFIGYFLFEIPANLLVVRLGARTALAWMMGLWSVASAATALIATPLHFYIVRFSLGLFEAGLFPGLILCISFWFPAARRGRIIALLFVATLVTNAVIGPISGGILEAMEGVAGLHNWQWLFLLEAAPSLVCGVVAYLVLVDGPAKAEWLSGPEKDTILKDLKEEEAAKITGSASRRQTFSDPGVYIFSFGLFAVLAGFYAVTFWTPMIIRSAGVTNMLHIGLYAIIPNVISALAMLWTARKSDAAADPRWYFVVPLFLAAIGLAVTSLQGSLPVSILALSIASAGVMCALPTIWAMVTAYLPAATAAVGIAFINSVGVLSGFVTPYLVGSIRTSTGSSIAAFSPIWLAMLAGAVVIAVLAPKRHLTAAPPNGNAVGAG